MVLVQSYIESLESEGLNGREIAEKLGVSTSMISTYKHNDYNPSISVAKKVYKDVKITLHPFSTESLEHEINKG